MLIRSSSLELLEARIAPAGIVKIALSHGTVTLSGDAMNNQISIVPISPGVLEITPLSGTHLQFGAADSTAAVDIPGYAKDLKVSLAGGNDSVTLGAGLYVHDVTLDGGTGANSFTYGGLQIAGKFSVTAKEGNDTVTASNDIFVGRDYSLTLGNGFNNISHQVGEFVVIGKFTVLGGTADETFNFTSADTSIGGNASLKTGQGFDSITFSATKKLQIIGKLDVAGAEVGTVHAALGGLASNLSITAGDIFAVGGNVTFTAKNQSSGVEFGGTNSTAITGNLTVKTGNTSTITVDGATDFILGNVSFQTKGDTTLTVQPSGSYFIGGKFSYTGGKGADTINMVANGTIVGNATFSLGDGNQQTLKLGGKTGGLAAVLGSLTISSAEVIPPPSPIMVGTSSTTTLALLLVGGKFSLTTGASDDTVNMDDFTIRGASSIALGAGADQLNVETLGLPGASEFMGALTATLGAGNDNAVFGAAGNGNSLTFDVASTVDAGAGTDNVQKSSAKLTVKNAEGP
jgi:hypothetical protein